MAYDALSAEQLYEEREGYWSSLLRQFKNNSRVLMDVALKVTCRWLVMFFDLFTEYMEVFIMGH